MAKQPTAFAMTKQFSSKGYLAIVNHYCGTKFSFSCWEIPNFQIQYIVIFAFVVTYSYGNINFEQTLGYSDSMDMGFEHAIRLGAVLFVSKRVAVETPYDF